MRANRGISTQAIIRTYVRTCAGRRDETGRAGFRPARPSRCATRALPSPTVQPHLAPRLAAPRAPRWRLGRRSLSDLGRARSGQDAPGARVRPRAVGRRRQSAVVIACPTAPLTRQWARAADDLGIDLAPDADSPKPPSGFHGVSVTYARVAKAPARWARALPRRTLVIADEAHHLGEDLTWGVGFAKAFAASPRWLLLSGTPFRSDATPIPGVSYDADGMAEPDVSYSYAEAVADGVCRPVCFVAYDGTLSWRSGDDVIESSFETVLSTREASRRYRTAISTDLPDGLPRILGEADAKLGHPPGGPSRRRRPGRRRRLRARPADREAAAGGDGTSAGGRAARRDARGDQARRLHQLHGSLDRGRQHGLRGRRHPAPAGGRVRDGGQDAAHLPPDRGPVRAHAPRPPGRAQLAVCPRRPGPARPRGHHRAGAARIAAPAWEEDPFALDERDERRRPSAPTRRVRPVECRRGAADDAVRRARTAPQSAAARWAGRDGRRRAGRRRRERAPRVPAFERRAQLRDERHRLVSEVRRRDGTSHREINAWLNRKIGITRVEDATLAELERSVELLMGKLTRRR